jgi:hypothetical protein
MTSENTQVDFPTRDLPGPILVHVREQDSMGDIHTAALMFTNDTARWLHSLLGSYLSTLPAPDNVPDIPEWAIGMLEA